MERDRARVLHFAVFYLYLTLTIAQRTQELGRNRGVCVACNVDMNDL